MHLVDIHVIRPIPTETSRLGVIAGRVGRLALLYAMIALAGAVIGIVVALASWRLVAITAMLLAVVGLVSYAATRLYPLAHIRAWIGQRQAARCYPVPPRTERTESAPVERTADFPIGAIVADRFRIESVIGRGSTGTVYTAADEELRRPVAITTLTSAGWGSAESTEVLAHAVAAASRITHPNVMRTYASGQAYGVPFIATELVHGYSLQELLNKSSEDFPVRTALAVARQMAAGLWAMHEQGVAHGDLRPETVLVNAKGEVKLTAFGVTSAFEKLYDDSPLSHYKGSESAKPRRALDARTDIYAFGMLLYQLLAGRPAFDFLTYRPLADTPEPLVSLRPEVSPELSAIVFRCLMPNPADRYQDAGALLADLERLSQQQGATQIA